MHITTDPPILYFGTPVSLISTENEDATANLAPMSSAWWLGHRCVLGLAGGSRTTQNRQRTGECVLNLPKRRRGYRHVAEKFTEAGLTPVASDLVNPPRVAECQVQMEATLQPPTPSGKGAFWPLR